MSKADISPTLIRSRRAVLAGVACAAALPLAATAALTAAHDPIFAAASVDDPIFAAIAVHRTAIENVRAAEAVLGMPDHVFSPIVTAECEAVDCLVEVEPTTVQGLLAVLVHLAEAYVHDSEVISDDHLEPLLANLGEAAERFLNGAGKAVAS